MVLSLQISPNIKLSTLHDPVKAEVVVARLNADDLDWRYSIEPVGSYSAIRVADENGKLLGYL